MPSSIQAIAFDLDNTLLDRDAAFRRLISDWTGIHENRQSAIDAILEQDNHGYSDRDELFHFLAEMQVFGNDEEALRKQFIGEFPTYFAPDLSIHALIERLQNRDIELAVLSNGGSEFQRAKFENSGLVPFFDPTKVVISGEIGFDKPAPEAFRFLAGKLNTTPEKTLFVGDHFENDVLGASLCGFLTCWVLKTNDDIYAKKSLFDFKINHLSELESTCLT